MLHFDEATHTYTFNSRPVPSVTQVLQAEQFVDVTWFTEHGRDRGKKAHLAIHLYDMGDLDEDSLDPALAPYLDAWKKFKQDSGFKIYESESAYYHPFLQYAGTPDKYGELNGKAALIDIKTGAVQEWVRIQLSAYAELISNGPLSRFSIQLKDDGSYRLTEYKDRSDRGIWMAALSCYQWKNNNLKRR